MTPRRSWAARVYGVALWLLPPLIRRDDGDEMVGAFDEAWRGGSSFTHRMWRAVRAFGVLPVVAAAEWRDELGLGGRDEIKGGGMMGWRDLSFAVRTLRKAPSFSFTTVLLIGLGVGAVTTMFTLVDHVLLRPLPYPDADRIVVVENGAHSGPMWRELQTVGSIEVWAAAYDETGNLTGGDAPLRIRQARVTSDFLSLFGARPALGRLLVGDDFSDPSLAVLSHGTWERVFGADPAVLGSTVRIDDEAVTVVGVLDADFQPPRTLVGSQIDFVRPLDMQQPELESIDYRFLSVAGRLTPGAGADDAQADIDVVSARIADLYPGDMVDEAGAPYPFPVTGLQDATVQRVRGGLLLLMGAVAVLLLVACLNVAHLFLARGLGRVQEMSVRRALGAGTGGLFRQLLAESLVIGVAGGVLGTVLALLGLQTFLGLNPGAIPGAETVSLDARVLGFAGLVALATAVVFGLLPAFRTVGSDLTVAMKGGSRGATSGRGMRRVRSSLVVAEVALSLILMAQAGLLLRSFMQVTAHDPGFEVEGLWTLPLNLSGIDSPERYREVMGGLEEALRGVPGVAHSTYGLTMPFEYTGGSRCCWGNRITHEGQDLRVSLHPVSGSYFETLALPLIAGEAWREAEATEVPIPVVATERFAVEIFGSADRAIGQIFAEDSDEPWRVVGVSADAKHYGLDQDIPLSIYLPMAALPFPIPRSHAAVRVAGPPPADLARTLREAVWNVDRNLPVPTVRPMEEWIEQATAGRRFDSVLFGVFGGLALLLAAAGLYGTLLYTVRQRRRELGIRIALGAARSRVEAQVVRSGLLLATAGLVLGGAGAWYSGRLLESRLYGVEAGDPTTLIGAGAVLMATAVLASWLPARRAASVDPVETLREE